MTRDELLDYDPYPRMAGGQERYKCPVHGGDRQRSLSVDPETGRYFCHACGARGVLENRLVNLACVTPRPRRGARAPRPAWLADRNDRLDPDSVARYEAAWQGTQPLAGSPAQEYLESRGISLDVAEASGARYHPNLSGCKAVAFPVHDENGVRIALIARRFGDGVERQGAQRSYGPRSRGVFTSTPDALDGAIVGFAEAPIDALTLAQAGLPSAAFGGVCGGTFWPDWLPARVRHKTVLVATDADEAGEYAARSVTAALQAYGARVHRLELPHGCKDWNEVLQAYGARAVRSAVAPFLRHVAHSTARTARLDRQDGLDIVQDVQSAPQGKTGAAEPDVLPPDAEAVVLAACRLLESKRYPADVRDLCIIHTNRFLQVNIADAVTGPARLRIAALDRLRRLLEHIPAGLDLAPLSKPAGTDRD